LVNATGASYSWPIEIYSDVATTLWTYGTQFPREIYDDVYYKISNASTPAIGVIGWTDDDSFETSISFKQAEDTNVITKLPLFAYPFDEVSSIILTVRP
jgi:hypothetical protein